MSTLEADLPAYEVYVIKDAQRSAMRRDHFLLGDLHEAPMDMDYVVWVIVGKDRARCPANVISGLPWRAATRSGAGRAARHQLRPHIAGHVQKGPDQGVAVATSEIGEVQRVIHGRNR